MIFDVSDTDSLQRTEPTRMRNNTLVFSSVPNRLLELLSKRLPSSLIILRRLQFAKRDAGADHRARTIVSADSLSLGKGPIRPMRMTVAHVDVSYSPNTQLYLYSTLEDRSHEPNGSTPTPEDEAQLRNVVETIICLRKDNGGEPWYPRQLILGSLHSDVEALLAKSGRLTPLRPINYDKWIFKTQELPTNSDRLPEGMFWGHATPSDCRVVVARTQIPRNPEMLVKLPNLVIKLQDETPIAWGFLGMDGTMMTLHCEANYRRKGLAKKLASKLLREGRRQILADDEEDGLVAADVSADNVASRAVCQSLNGHPMWTVTWNMFDIGHNEELGPRSSGW
ncbi:hypothetical protein HIM_03826 [Hirsutella minnesotensis 3608]|uniref:FR47-like domain-containing protein n=1 Tax=Hirsutella minnesotensis 3608 TaxID=1043627 RepID=A0A0F8A6E7_9HYPO|nr:hypothetical protein HIM_03826 [Hirsutella minnesotensis 3608]